MTIFSRRNLRPANALRLSSGFTLVELLVVIAIIGVLATLLLLQLGTARAKARDAKRITDINGMRTSLELAYDDNNSKYPADISDALIGKYISTGKVPKDPVTVSAYFYAVNPSTSAATKYHLWTELEAKNVAALAGDADMDSSTASWVAVTAGSKINASAATTEACTAAYAAGAATDCIYDVGQN